MGPRITQLVVVVHLSIYMAILGLAINWVIFRPVNLHVSAATIIIIVNKL